MPESLGSEKLLLFCADPAALEQARAALASRGELREASHVESARQLYQQETPDLIVVDAGAAAQLLPELDGEEEVVPPVIVLGSAEGARGAAAIGVPSAATPGPQAFAYLSSIAELPLWVLAALRYRRLQVENKLIHDESERIYSELLKSYGAVAEQRQQLEEEVKRRTVELQHYAKDLEKQVQERTRQLVQQEKMAALGALVAGIAHDMHTPIGTITSNSDVLSRSLARLNDLIAGEACPESFRNSPELKRVLGIIEEISRVNQLACERIIGIVRSLRNFARLDEAEVRGTDLHEGIESTLTLVHHELRNRITVKREYGEIPLVACHPNQLNQVFMNMLVNASHAIAEKGTITIRTFREGDMVKVQISDTGHGIKPEDVAKIFEPGFTTKEAGVGTGLGLAICTKVIRDHRGKIEVESEVGRGTTFTISLPLEWKTL